jgi:hypothetical protein
LHDDRRPPAEAWGSGFLIDGLLGVFGKKFELDTTFDKPQCGRAQSLPFLLARRIEPDALPFSFSQSATIIWLRHRPQKLQLPHQPPRHEKNADTDPDGEQHIDHCTSHPVEPAAAAIVIKVLLIFAWFN